MKPTLIILRGNSGCGKTSTAKLLREMLGSKVMLVSQDVVRREMLRVKDTDGNPAIELLYEVCMYGNRIGHTVILEGILSKAKYGAMLHRLIEDFAGIAQVYYFDVPFEETVRRHAMKSNAHEFGEKEMREWWKDRDYLGVTDERMIGKAVNQDDIIVMIARDLNVSS